MAEKSFPLENTAYTAEDAQLWFATRQSGVYAGSHLGVTANGTMAAGISSGGRIRARPKAIALR